LTATKSKSIREGLGQSMAEVPAGLISAAVTGKFDAQEEAA
jgi:hypothetical protein